jgi:DNA replication protein DnaD
MNTQTQPPSNYSLHDKWGNALDEGFVVIPAALLRHQHKLEICDGELVVLMNLIMAWWKVGDFPFPRTSTMAKRMGVSARTVQRHIERLEEKNLIRRFGTPERRNAYRATTQYDLSGIVGKLKELGASVTQPQEASRPSPTRAREQDIPL